MGTLRATQTATGNDVGFDADFADLTESDSTNYRLQPMAVCSAAELSDSGSRWAITGFEVGNTSIHDGGGDMYDNGNRVSVDRSAEVRYADGCRTLQRGNNLQCLRCFALSTFHYLSPSIYTIF